MTTGLWEQFDRIVVFDTETTGIDARREEIIELGAVCLEPQGEVDSLNCLIRLSPGRVLPPVITELTGITPAQLEAEGIPKETAAQAFCRLWETAERPLLVAYNAQFDLNFLYGFLQPLGLTAALRAPRFLDALTVYRDRRDYPHKLSNAIAAYALADAVNSHRAVDDARATAALLAAMGQEKDDLAKYLDLFGYNPRYGISGRRAASVTYRAQPYQRTKPLYELPDDGKT